MNRTLVGNVVRWVILGVAMLLLILSSGCTGGTKSVYDGNGHIEEPEDVPLTDAPNDPHLEIEAKITTEPPVMTEPPINSEAYSKFIESGNAYNDLGEYSKAITEYSKAMELDPSYATAYYFRGSSYHNMRDHPAAISDYSKAIDKDPEYTLAYVFRGQAYRQISEYEKAQQDYEKAASLDPYWEGLASRFATPTPTTTALPTTVPAATPSTLTFLSVNQLPNGEVDEPYSYSFCKPDLSLTSDLCGGPFDTTTDPIGGEPPYTFQLDTMGGFPPHGVILNLNGMLTGTPTVAGETEFKVCAFDQTKEKVCREKSLLILPSGTPPTTEPPTTLPPTTPPTTSPPQAEEVSATIDSATCADLIATLSGTASGPVGSVLYVSLDPVCDSWSGDIGTSCKRMEGDPAETQWTASGYIWPPGDIDYSISVTYGAASANPHTIISCPG